MAQYKGMGWHRQSIRHSNARKYGRAGGKYKGQFYALFPKAPFSPEKKPVIIQSKNKPIASDYKGFGFAEGGYKTKKEVVKRINELGYPTYKEHFGKSNGGFDAGEVLRQLGGNKFIAMTGANSFVRDDEKQTILFKVPHAQNRIKYVKIRLNVMDTYDVEFLSRNGVLIEKVDGVYNDQLQSTFTEHTGLYTYL